MYKMLHYRLQRGRSKAFSQGPSVPLEDIYEPKLIDLVLAIRKLIDLSTEMFMIQSQNSCIYSVPPRSHSAERRIPFL